jgi:O-methyltransferase
VRAGILAEAWPTTKRMVRNRFPLLQRLRKYSMNHPTYGHSYAIEVARAYDSVRAAAVGLALRRADIDCIAGAIAELGVYRGDLSRLLHALAPDRTLYLFDTFRGFPGSEDLRFRDTSAELVRHNIGDQRNVLFREGVFPGTARGLEHERFAFVMLDADVYQVTVDGLEFFYPRLSVGGYLFVHDYNSTESNRAVSKAVDEFFKGKPEVPIELPDRDGSVVIRKSSY